MIRLSGWILIISALGVVNGCAAHGPANPSFSLSVKDAERALREMSEKPRPMQRPLLILGGWFDPGIITVNLRRNFRNWTGDDRVISMAFPMKLSFKECRRATINAVDDAFPSNDEKWTTKVDVVAISMGGIVARYAAANLPDEPDSRRLRIARLFTVSTPHRGATLAPLASANPLTISMQVGSKFLERLSQLDEQRSYELYPYVRLGDLIVGSANAAPEGIVPWWIPNRFLDHTHLWVFRDPRIMADIARRIRYETPFTTEPREPLPGFHGLLQS